MRRFLAILSAAFLMGCEPTPPSQTRPAPGDATATSPAVTMRPPNTLAGPSAQATERGAPEALAPHIPIGRYIGRGLWGVHNAGNLRIRVRADGCDATYHAESAYFSATHHRLACKLTEDGSAAWVTEQTCTLTRFKPEEPAADGPCYPPAFGIHGSLRVDAVGHAAFHLDAKVVAARKRYSGVQELEMRVDTGPWK